MPSAFFPCSHNGSSSHPMRSSFSIEDENGSRDYSSMKGIIHTACREMELQRRDFIVLPFGHAIERNAISDWFQDRGICLGTRSDTRRAFEELANSGFRLANREEVQNLMKACQTMSIDGEAVVYRISGPITILSELIGLTKLFVIWRKDEVAMRQIFQIFSRILQEYAREMCRSGISVLSYSDPVGNTGLLGPVFSRAYANAFHLDFVKDVATLCKKTGTPFAVSPCSAMKGNAEIPPHFYEDSGANVVCYESLHSIHDKKSKGAL